MVRNNVSIKIYDEEVMLGEPLLEVFSNHHRDVHIGEHIEYESAGEYSVYVITKIFNCFSENGNVGTKVFVKRD